MQYMNRTMYELWRRHDHERSQDARSHEHMQLKLDLWREFQNYYIFAYIYDITYKMVPTMKGNFNQRTHLTFQRAYSYL